MGKIVAVVSLFLTVSAFAKNPPPLRGQTPRDISGPPAIDHPNPPPTPWIRGVGRDGNIVGLSSVNLPPPSDLAGRAVTNSATVYEDLAGSQGRWKIGPAAVPFSFDILYMGNVSAVSDGGQNFGDEEPSIIALNYGATYHVSAWQKKLSSPFRSRFYLSRYTESGGTITQSYPAVSLPTGYTDQGDPVLAVNPYGQGVRPYGVYLGGMTFNRDAQGFGTNPKSIRVWVSSDGGATFDSIGMGVHYTEGTSVTLDKPTIDVSWFSSTLGYVYVTYVEWALQGQGNRILLRRSTSGVTRRCRPSGGGCIDPFDPVVEVHNGNDGYNAYTPLVVVNSDNGNVYVVFTRNDGFYMKVSRDYGVTFPGVPIRIANQPPHGMDYHLPNGQRAALVPMARYNPITRRLMVVWHGAQSAGNADVYYSDFDADTVTQATMPTPVRYSQTYDQYQPAIDNDDSGKALISYYDNAGGNGFSYFPYGRYVAQGGVTHFGPSKLFYEGFAGFNSYTGDYHEIWYWGSRWNNSWVRTSDVFVTGIR